MRPVDVLHYKVDLMSRLESSDFLAITKDAIRRQISGFGIADAAQLEACDLYVGVVQRQVPLSDAYLVTENMVDLVSHAAKSLDDEDSWDRTFAPTSSGLVRFEKPIQVGTWANGKSLCADWLLWGPSPSLGDSKHRTMLYWFMDPARPGAGPDGEYSEIPESIVRIIGQWDLVGWSSIIDGEPLGPQKITNHVPPEYRDGQCLTEDGLWQFSAEQESDKRLLHALWLLLGQEIVVSEKADLDRSATRKAIKRKIPPAVTIIRLRRRKHAATNEETHVEWQHRWFVRGHWAWRKCGEYLHGAVAYEKGFRRRIYIPMHAKGPEGAPLKMTEKVYVLAE